MRKHYISLAAFSVALVLPTAGAFAQDNNASTRNDNVPAMRDTTAMMVDAGQFKDTLYRVRELFNEMKEHHRLANATNDAMIRGKHQEDSRSLLIESISLLDSINQNWSYGDIQKLASEGDDSAFVRMTVWDLRNMLEADRLNGRDAIINTSMWKLLDAAIQRVESPNFRVANGGVYHSRVSTSDLTWSTPGDTTIPHFETSTGTQYVATERTDSRRTEIPPIATRPDVTTITREETTAEPAPEPTPTTTETVIETRPLPKTGGDPSLLFLLGSTLTGAGALLRRRRK